MINNGITINDWVLISGAFVSIGGLILNIRKNVIETRRYNADITSKLSKLDKNLKDVNNDLTFIKNQAKKTTKGLKYTQRYRLYTDLTKAIYRGYNWLEEYREITKLFASYKFLGGNGEIESLYEVYKNLPMKEDEDGEFIKKSD